MFLCLGHGQEVPCSQFIEEFIYFLFYYLGFFLVFLIKHEKFLVNLYFAFVIVNKLQW